MQVTDEDSNRTWTEPGIYRVTDGVYRIPLPMPNDGLRSINVYALTDGNDTVLVDSGWGLDEARDQLEQALRGIDVGLGDISQFLITHVHRDHYTMAVRLRREFGNHIALGQLEEPSLKATADPDNLPMAAQGRLLLSYGAADLVDELTASFGDPPPREALSDWEQPDEWLQPGNRAVLSDVDLDVIHTPGHTAGHLVFADTTRGLLFSGDHVLPRITPSIGFEPVPTELPLRDFLTSLRTIEDMPDRILLPAHGSVTGSVHQRVRELLDHHNERLTVMGETVAAGSNTPYEVANQLNWTRRNRALGELDIFNRTLAVLETAAHLELLAFQGSLTVAEQGGARYFTQS